MIHSRFAVAGLILFSVSFHFHSFNFKINPVFISSSEIQTYWYNNLLIYAKEWKRQRKQTRHRLFSLSAFNSAMPQSKLEWENGAEIRNQIINSSIFHPSQPEFNSDFFLISFSRHQSHGMRLKSEIKHGWLETKLKINHLIMKRVP